MVSSSSAWNFFTGRKATCRKCFYAQRLNTISYIWTAICLIDWAPSWPIFDFFSPIFSYIRVILCQLDKLMSPWEFQNWYFIVDSSSNFKKKPHITFFSKTSPFWSRPFWTLRLFFSQKRVKFTKWPPKMSRHVNTVLRFNFFDFFHCDHLWCFEILLVKIFLKIEDIQLINLKWSQWLFQRIWNSILFWITVQNEKINKNILFEILAGRSELYWKI
jgi:hypothetical protein